MIVASRLTNSQYYIRSRTFFGREELKKRFELLGRLFHNHLRPHIYSAFLKRQYR